MLRGERPFKLRGAAAKNAFVVSRRESSAQVRNSMRDPAAGVCTSLSGLLNSGNFSLKRLSDPLIKGVWTSYSLHIVLSPRDWCLNSESVRTCAILILPAYVKSTFRVPGIKNSATFGKRCGLRVKYMLCTQGFRVECDVKSLCYW